MPIVVRAFLATHTLCNDDVQGHLDAFVIKLLLDSMEELSEQFVVAFDRSRMLTWCLRLDLWSKSVKPSSYLVGVEA